MTLFGNGGQHAIVTHGVSLDSAAPPVDFDTMPSLNVLSINTNGLNDDKWSAIDALVRLLSVHIVCLQETHLHAGSSWRMPPSHQFSLFRCDASVSRAGVAILVFNGLCPARQRPSIAFADQDEGRTLIIDVPLLNGSTLRCASIYFPVGGDERLPFIDALPWAMLENAIIGCDSNMKLSRRDVIPVIASDTASPGADLFRHYLFQHDLFDAFYELSGDDVSSLPTTRRATRGSRASSIDRILFSVGLCARPLSVDVHAFPLSDHDAILLAVHDFPRSSTLTRRRPALAGYLLNNNGPLTDELKHIVAVTSSRVENDQFASMSEAWDYCCMHTSRLLDAAHHETMSEQRNRTIRTTRRQIQKHNKLLRTPGLSVARRIQLTAALRRYYIVLADVEAHCRRVRRARWARHALRDRITSQDASRFMRMHADKAGPILAAHDGTRTVTDMPGIIGVHTKFWSDLRSQPHETLPQHADFERALIDSIRPDDNARELSFDVECDAVEASIRRLNRNSAAGPDRMSCAVFLAAPAEFAKLLWLIWQRRLDGLPSVWRESITVLLYKGDDRDKLLPSSYRPISLESVALRVLCGAVQQRNSIYYDSLINQEQRAFVRSRQITESIAEIFAAANDARVNDSALAILVFDFVKAYDTISRSWMLKTLAAMGCTSAFVDDVANLFANSSSRLSINGFLGESIAIERGVAQGNCLSCFLYIAAVSMIPTLLYQAEVDGYRPNALLSHEPSLVASMYVDNLVTFASSSRDVVQTRRALEAFAWVSGQKPDKNKLRIITINLQLPSSLTRFIVPANGSVRILGAYMDGKGALHRCTWDGVIERMARTYLLLSRLCWSYAERLFAANTFAIAKIRYLARTFFVPPDVIRECDKAFAQFLFKGKRFHPSIKALLMPMSFGGVSKNGSGFVKHICLAQVARRAVLWYCGKTPPRDVWMWRDANQYVIDTMSAVPSPVVGVPVSHMYRLSRKGFYNPAVASQCALAAAKLHSTNWIDVCSDVDRLLREPLYGNPIFGATFSKRLSDRPKRIGDVVFGYADRARLGIPKLPQSKSAQYLTALQCHWPALRFVFTELRRDISIAIPSALACRDARPPALAAEFDCGLTRIARFVAKHDGVNVTLFHAGDEFPINTELSLPRVIDSVAKYLADNMPQIDSLPNDTARIESLVKSMALAVMNDNVSHVSRPVRVLPSTDVVRVVVAPGPWGFGGTRLLEAALHRTLVFPSSVFLPLVGPEFGWASARVIANRIICVKRDANYGTLPLGLRASIVNWATDDARRSIELHNKTDDVARVLTRQEPNIASDAFNIDRIVFDNIKTCHLTRRFFMLDQPTDNWSRYVSAFQFSFTDLVKFHKLLARADFDFVWRLLHNFLPFASFMEMSGNRGLLSACPMCHADVSRCSRDHTTRDCQFAVEVYNSLRDWFYFSGILQSWDVGRQVFSAVWRWQKPSKHQCYKAAFTLSLVAKRALWRRATSICFGTENEVNTAQRMSADAVALCARKEFIRRAQLVACDGTWTDVLRIVRN